MRKTCCTLLLLFLLCLTNAQATTHILQYQGITKGGTTVEADLTLSLPDVQAAPLLRFVGADQKTLDGIKNSTDWARFATGTLPGDWEYWCGQYITRNHSGFSIMCNELWFDAPSGNTFVHRYDTSLFSSSQIVDPSSWPQIHLRSPDVKVLSPAGSLTFSALQDKAQALSTLYQLQIGAPLYVNRWDAAGLHEMDAAQKEAGKRIGLPPSPPIAGRAITPADALYYGLYPVTKNGLPLHHWQPFSVGGFRGNVGTHVSQLSLAIDQQGTIAHLRLPLLHMFQAQGAAQPLLSPEQALDAFARLYREDYLPKHHLRITDIKLLYFPLMPGCNMTIPYAIHPAYMIHGNPMMLPASANTMPTTPILNMCSAPWTAKNYSKKILSKTSAALHPCGRRAAVFLVDVMMPHACALWYYSSSVGWLPCILSRASSSVWGKGTPSRAAFSTMLRPSLAA